MTLFKSLFIQTRLLVTLLALALYTGPLRAETDGILVSDLPISDLLTHLKAPKHLGDAALTFSFSVTNDTDAPALWYLHSEVLEPIAFQMFAAGQSAPVFQSPFAARVQKSHASQGPILRSDLIILPPRERLEITARFEQAAVAKPFPIRLDFKEVLDDQDKRRLLSHGTFLGAMVAFIVMFLLSPNFLMNAASRWFAFYLASMTLLAMHSHGYGFSLFDLSPHIYFAVLRVLHTGVMLGYILFVLSFLNASKSYPLFWRCALVYIAFGLTTAVLEQVLASPAFQYAPILVPLFFVGFGAVGAYLALRDRLHGARFLAAGYAVLLVGGLVNYVASFPPLAQWNDVIDQVTMLLQAGDAVIFGGALLSQMYGMRRMRDLAVEAQMTEMQRRLDLNAKLRSTKGDLRRARDLAERHRANLAETSHDLRQPITSLRMALQSAQSRSPESVSDLSAGIDFLDKLLVQTLEESHPSTGAGTPDHDPDPDTVVALQVIFLNAQRMFAQEADQKGLSLTFVPTSLSVRAQTIDLIRIVSNLVSNAVRYTRQGRIVIGVRRRNGRATIEIWDTGPGITEKDQAQIVQPYIRGGGNHAPDGHGLGLSIVKQLAEKNELDLNICSIPGRGSVFMVQGLMIVQAAPPSLTSK